MAAVVMLFGVRRQPALLWPVVFQGKEPFSLFNLNLEIDQEAWLVRN